MATKCRKWVSFTAFFLGVSLLVAAACCAYGLSYRFSLVDVADAFASNYQTTQRFRSLMEERLDIFMNGARDHPHQADYDEAYRDEDSLLYLVVKGDTLLWTNAADFDLPADLGKLPGYLPIGYNFSLYFDGKSISMNGAPEATDLDKWFLPGQDTEVPVSAASTQVWLCASEAPGWVFQNYVTSQLTICRGYLKSALVSLILGVGFFILYLFLRKDKPEADRAIAAVTGRVWFEFKLLFLLLGLWFLIIAVDMLHYARPAGYALTGLWVCWLFLNDCRRNEKTWRHSASALLSQAWRQKEADLPLRKRMVRRGSLALLGTLPLCALGLPFLLRATGFSFSYPIWMWVGIPLAVSLAILAVLCLPLLWFIRGAVRFAGETDRLAGRVAAMRAGDLSAASDFPRDSTLLAAAADLSAIGEGMAAALEDRLKSERMKVELIANVSHDLKTPLTSITSYAQLLKEEEGLPGHVEDYIRILDEKAQRLGGMVQDVFEISKAASGTMPVKREELDLGKLIDQTLADMAEEVEKSGLLFKVDLPRKPVLLTTDGDRLYRVFQNLFQNALRYSLPGSRVYVTLKEGQGRILASVKNTSKDELPSGVDFTARFVRGDETRTDGGSGLGLAIASSFTTACGGSFRVETDADLFTALVEFPQAVP